MKRKLYFILILSSFAVCAEEESGQLIEELEKLAVEGEVYETKTVKLIPESSSVLKDTADVLKKMPGAYVNKNGALSGIAQYRGLFGSRVNVQADGVQVVESCSNSMDAAMSHVPASMVDAVILQRGISPISQGMETLGGSIEVVSRSAESSTNSFSGDVSLGYASANQGKTGALNLQYKLNNHAFFVGLDVERGENQSTPLGKNVFTGLERDYYAASYQFDNGRQLLVLSSNYNDTGETGTPALPMDITYAQGGISQIDFTTKLNKQWKLNAALSYQNTEHLMDNYLHRSQLPVNQRESLTRVNKNAFSLQAINTGDDCVISFGFDYDDVDNIAVISNPNNAQFRITNFDVTKERFSFFTEYQKQLSEQHQYMLGVRFTDTQANAGTVLSSVAMMDNNMGMLHRTLRDRFNAVNQTRSDQNTDFMFNWQHALNQQLSLAYGFAIKNRTPTHQERYLWLPLEATAGLADGRQYLGNLDLQSEQAYQWELGINFQQGAFTTTPHMFYHRINDYIQGVPNTVMPAPAGVLRYANVDAELYGFDVESSYQFNDQFSMRHVISYVRGKRRDIDDNLYRIAPLNTWVNLSYAHQQWQFEADIMAAVRQDKVSITNTEKATPGFGVLHLSAIKSFKNDSYVKLSVNNVFDKLYYQHTNGYNRNNTNTDVGFDANNLQAYRLPSEGRSLQVSYFYGW